MSLNVPFLAPTGAQDVKMSCVRACVTLFKRTLKMSSRELKQASKQESRQAGKHAGKQADRQAGRQASKQVGRQASKQAGRQASKQAGRQASKQAGTRKAFSRSHALEGLVYLSIYF